MMPCTQHGNPVSWGWRQTQTGDQRSIGVVARGCPVPYPAARGCGISERVARATRFQDRPMALSKTLRFEIFKRDAFTCQYCGRTPPGVVLEIDHFLALANGGCDEEENLLTSCFDCNRGKGANPATRQALPSIAERTAAMVEAEEQITAYRKALQAKDRRLRAAIRKVEQHVESLGDIHLTDHGRRRVVIWLRQWTPEKIIEAFDIATRKLPVGDRGLFAYVGGILRKWRQGVWL